MQRESLNTREQSREDKGEDGERKNATASVESKREEADDGFHPLSLRMYLCLITSVFSLIY